MGQNRQAINCRARKIQWLTGNNPGLCCARIRAPTISPPCEAVRATSIESTGMNRSSSVGFFGPGGRGTPIAIPGHGRVRTVGGSGSMQSRGTPSRGPIDAVLCSCGILPLRGRTNPADDQYRECGPVCSRETFVPGRELVRGRDTLLQSRPCEIVGFRLASSLRY
jgi:hypothetical protein